VKNKSLSQLVRDYSAGEINEREYREMRTKLIQDIVVGNTIIEKTKYIPPTNQKNNTGIKKESKNKKKINLQNKRPLFIAISVLGIVSIILIIGVLTLR
jgi:ATP-dependent Zn protease|tara:strand:+ start:3881 stop:4177 length:297 start_codon:yes stop_codon:yes gene_type:complete